MHKVLVLDSGLGGLNVLDRLKNLRSDIDYIYFADQSYCPYGEKNVEQICRRIQHMCLSFGNVVREVVLACNTASACMYQSDDLSKITSNGMSFFEPKFEVISTIQPTTDAVFVQSPNIVCLLATRLCVNTGVYQSIFKQRNLDCVAVDCSNFVRLVEEGVSYRICKNIVCKTLQSVVDKENVDSVVLGCTHFDYLCDAIKECFGRQVKYVSSSDEVAKYAAANLQRKYCGCGNVEYLSSGNFQNVSKISRQTGRNFKLIDV